MPGARSSSASCRVDHTTRCPRGWNVVGPSNSSLKEPSVHGESRAARVCAPGYSRLLQGGGEVAQQRRRPGPGVRVVADPGRGVGGGDRLVEGGAFLRWRLLPEQHRDEGVQEQGPPGQRVRAAVPGRDVQGVDPDAGRAELDGGAADGVAQPQVLVFGVDDGDLDAVVERAQGLQLDQVAFAGAGAGEHHGVVVVAGPAVPPDDAVGGAVEPVQHPAGGYALAGQRRRQVGAGAGGTRRRGRRCRTPAASATSPPRAAGWWSSPAAAARWPAGCRAGRRRRRRGPRRPPPPGPPGWGRGRTGSARPGTAGPRRGRAGRRGRRRLRRRRR